jgi:hypothetical protein
VTRTRRGPGDGARRARLPGGRGSTGGLLASPRAGRERASGWRRRLVKDRDRLEWVSFSDRGVREGPGKWVEFLDPYACDFLRDLRARESCPLRCPGTSLARRVDLRRHRKRDPPWGTVDGRQDNHQTMTRASFPEGRGRIPHALAPFSVTRLRSRQPVARRGWGGFDGDTRPHESQPRGR